MEVEGNKSQSFSFFADMHLKEKQDFRKPYVILMDYLGETKTNISAMNSKTREITFTSLACLIFAILLSFQAEREICPFGRRNQAHRTTVGCQSSET